MAISEDSIRKVKEVTDIVEVINDFVLLKKKGQNWLGLSPFTNEKTPSFSVSPSKGIFKDFSSGKAGDAITFLMEHEGLGYIEAIKYLAGKYGIEIEETVPSEEDKQRTNEIESLYIALNFANDYFVDQLQNTNSGKAIGLSYFKERGFNESTIEKFQLGFTQEDWDSFLKHARKMQFSEEVLEKSGLIIKKDEKVYDRFRSRVIFPIHNILGKVVGFGARTLSQDKKQPKYINSPETPVYNKSKELYGIYYAKNAIRNEDSCILVEGYTDVISLHQAGIENVISSSGTALTEEQIKVIKRFTNNLILLFDGDAAGLRAAERGVKMVLQAGMNLHVLNLPEGADPDSFVRKIGGEAFKEYLNSNKQDFLSFKTRLGVESVSGDPFKKAELIKEIVELIAVIPDPITRSVYFKACSTLLNIEEEVLITDFNKKLRNAANKSSQERNSHYADAAKKPISEREYIDGLVEINQFKAGDSEFKEREILKSLLKFSNIIVEDEVEEKSVEMGEFLLESIEEIEFKTPKLIKILEVFKQFKGKGKYPEDTDFLENEEFSEHKNTVIDIISEKHTVSQNWSKHNIHVPSDEDILLEKVYLDIYRLKWHKVKELKEETLDKIKSLEKNEGTHEEMNKLLKQFNELKKVERDISNGLGNVIS